MFYLFIFPLVLIPLNRWYISILSLFSFMCSQFILSHLWNCTRSISCITDNKMLNLVSCTVSKITVGKGVSEQLTHELLQKDESNQNVQQVGRRVQREQKHRSRMSRLWRLPAERQADCPGVGEKMERFGEAKDGPWDPSPHPLKGLKHVRGRIRNQVLLYIF